MTKFTKLYKELSNNELLKIISESDKYTPIAIETARKEIKSRNLSNKELIEIQNNLEKKKIEKQKLKQDKKKIKNEASSILELFNPIQPKKFTPKKIIQFISIVFSIISIYNLIKEFWIIEFVLSDESEKWDLSMIELLLPIILLPIAVFLFWKRKKIGWVLLLTFLTYSSTNTIGLLYMNFNIQPTGIQSIDSIFPKVPPVNYLITFIFFTGTLWMVCKENIRSIFKISKLVMFLVIGLTILVNLVYFVSVITG